MGAVYLCEDPLLKRKVAVKIVLKTRADSALMMARFQRESEISAQLNHPHIITVYDVGSDDEVGPFLAMEYVDGGSLASHLEAGAVEPAAALDWLTQLGQALVAAERAGVVHRDIKPENMLVSRQGDLKLTDFGLARDDASSLTTTGTMMGTPTHTAPELLGGAQATPATDRWAFAVTAFQMVLGQLPHSGDTLAAVLHHIDREPPSIPEGTSAPLTRVFLKALHHDPERRYDSVLAFLTALADALGLRDKLAVRGLSAAQPVEPAAGKASVPGMKAPGETESISLPRSPSSPGRSGGAAASPVPGARLTRPPAELFKAVPADPAPLPEEVLVPRSSAPQILDVRTSAARIPLYRESGSAMGPTAKIMVGLAAAALAAAFFLWPRHLRIETSPPGAQLSLDGQPIGTSPADGRMRFGSHQLVASLEGFDTVSTVIHSYDDQVVVKLQPFTTWVDLQSVPPGATVTLGGQVLGTTPRKGLVVPDKPTPVVFTLHGYRRWEGTLGPGQRVPSPIRLVREAR